MKEHFDRWRTALGELQKKITLKTKTEFQESTIATGAHAMDIGLMDSGFQGEITECLKTVALGECETYELNFDAISNWIDEVEAKFNARLKTISILEPKKDSNDHENDEFEHLDDVNGGHDPNVNDVKNPDQELFPKGKLANPELEAYAQLLKANEPIKRGQFMALAREITGECVEHCDQATALNGNFKTHEKTGKIRKIKRE